jgi:hypothetical protein
MKEMKRALKLLCLLVAAGGFSPALHAEIHFGHCYVATVVEGIPDMPVGTEVYFSASGTALSATAAIFTTGGPISQMWGRYTGRMIWDSTGALIGFHGSGYSIGNPVLENISAGSTIILSDAGSYGKYIYFTQTYCKPNPLQ